MIFQKSIAVILLLAVGATSFQKAIALLDYRLNKNYIASTLCINKSKPKSCCQGKCYLTKQLQKEENGSRGNPAPSKEETNILLFLEQRQAGPINSINTVLYFDRYRIKTYQTLIPAIFHPPGKLC